MFPSSFAARTPSAWRSFWDWAIAIGSFLAAFLLGVAFANLAKGVPIDAKMNYTGTFWTLLNPYGLIGGLSNTAGFLLIGSIFLSLKTTGELVERAQKIARRLWILAVILIFALLVTTYIYTDILVHLGVDPGVVPIAAFAAILLTGYFINRKQNGWAFAMMGVHLALTLIACFQIMFPRVMISSTDPAFSLTIYNASSSPYTLKVMSIIALIFLPIVLAYQGWTYWVFRKRVEAQAGKIDLLIYERPEFHGFTQARDRGRIVSGNPCRVAISIEKPFCGGLAKAYCLSGVAGQGCCSPHSGRRNW